MKEKMDILIKKLWHSMVRNFRIWGGFCAAAVIALTGWLLWHEADSGTCEAAKELVQLNDNIRRHYQNKPDFWGLSTQTIVQNKIYPQQMFKNGGLTGFFGNDILVGRGENGEMLMPGARGFDIVYKNLNKKQCEELAAFRFDEKFWFGITGITLNNGKEQKYFTWSDKEYALPIRKNFVQTICGNSNILIWHCE